MIKFVNAKVNLGLNIVRKREDGYHDLETVFYPVGIESGMPQQPEPFDDILEVNIQKGKTTGCRFQLMGRKMDCDPEKNLVVKAATLFLKTYFDTNGIDDKIGLLNVILDKHLPDGAGLGGGSADASFTLIALNEIMGNPFSKELLARMARRLGADCPFFIYNTPCFAEGIGEILSPVNIDLKGRWMLIVKPQVYVSTKEAFAGIVPRQPDFDLRYLTYLPIEDWKGKVVNDFEESIFPQHPELGMLKEDIYGSGAVYSSMSGSGSSLYGIYTEEKAARDAYQHFDSTDNGVWLFKL